MTGNSSTNAHNESAHHKLSDTGENLYSFPNSDYMTKSQANLKNHELFPTKEKQYLCTQCKFEANSFSGLACHHKLHHSGKQPFFPKGITKSELNQSRYYTNKDLPSSKPNSKVTQESLIETKSKRKPENVHRQKTQGNVGSSQSISPSTKVKRNRTTSSVLKCLWAAKSLIFEPISQTVQSHETSYVSETSKLAPSDITGDQYTCFVCNLKVTSSMLTKHIYSHEEKGSTHVLCSSPLDQQVKSPETVGVSSGGNSLPSNHKKVEEKSCFICDFKCTSSSILSEHILSHANFKPAPIYAVSHSTESLHQTYSPLDDTSVATEIVTEKTPSPPVKESFNNCESFQIGSGFSQHSHTHQKDMCVSKYNCGSTQQLGLGKPTGYSGNCSKENVTLPTLPTLPEICNKENYINLSKKPLEMESNPRQKKSKKKNHSCSYCSYSCRSNSSMTIHERTHTGEKPFPCTYCKYRSNTKIDLKRHIYIHTGEKPYSCSHCEFKARTISYMAKHKRIHIKPESPM